MITLHDTRRLELVLARSDEASLRNRVSETEQISLPPSPSFFCQEVGCILDSIPPSRSEAPRGASVAVAKFSRGGIPAGG